MPASDRSKQPTSSVGPYRFFTARTQPQPGVPLALELHDDVDQVLEQPRTGDRAVLGDVPDQQRGDAALLRDPDQGGGDLADLGDVAGGAVDLGATRWSARSRRPASSGCDRVDVAEHGRQVGLGREVQRAREGARCARPAAAPGAADSSPVT